MFRLHFFGGFASQRRAFLADEDPALPAFHPVVERQIEGLAADLHGKHARICGRRALFFSALAAVFPLVLRCAFWNALSALVVLGGVFASREVLRSSTTLAFACMLSVLYLFSSLFQAAIEVFDIRRRAQINRAVQTYLFRVVNRKICVIDPAAGGRFTSGQVKTLIGSDVEAVEDFIGAAVMQWVPTLVMTVVMGGALFWVAGWFGVLALGLALLSVPFSVLGGRFIERFQGRAQRQQDSLTTLIGEWVRNIRLVRYLTWQPAVEAEVSRQMGAYCREFAFRHTVACIVYGLTASWWMVPILGIFAASAVSGINLTLESFFSTVWILNNLMNYVQHLPYSLSLYGTAVAGADRILALLQAPEITRGLQRAPASEGVIKGRATHAHLRDVVMDCGARVALQGITLSLDLRQRTAIVGAVGSGKSTLLEILIGERIPTSGEIEIAFEHGKKVRLWREDVYAAFRSQLAYSPQQPFLSNTKLRFNIDLAGTAPQPSAAASDLKQAVRKAQLEPDLALLPLGLEQEVGETGINLSGGQKQRVSLARAFNSKRPLFVLDDPLSAVDAATESALMDELLESARGLVMVSHRLSELSRCDRVLVLDEGNIVEDGSPLLLASDKDSRFSAFLRAVEEHG